MENRFIEAVESHFPIERGEIHPINPSLARYTPQIVQKEPLKLSTILVPKRDPEADPGIIPLSPSEFLTEFLGF